LVLLPRTTFGRDISGCFKILFPAPGGTPRQKKKTRLGATHTRTFSLAFSFSPTPSLYRKHVVTTSHRQKYHFRLCALILSQHKRWNLMSQYRHCIDVGTMVMVITNNVIHQITTLYTKVPTDYSDIYFKIW